MGLGSAEFPHFVPGTQRVLYSIGIPGVPARRIINTDGSGEVIIGLPGGNAVAHLAPKFDGTEFFQGARMTSYLIATGAPATLNDLKHTTTMMTQLGTLGLAEVPTSEIPGHGGQGTFALSADWSRDGARLVFDALVADRTTGAVRGIAIFTWDIAAGRLALIHGPEPFMGQRTNHFKYSMGTPKWIP
ncbi:MAG: hypothetical protein EXR92_01615 [Gemmatimonadetes bacterium]|nr:hypothetical protein [Gemmatimonadota bacterium]